MALLRGIGPLNPNMRNDKLRKVVEDLGFDNVRTVISTGNVLFDTSRRGMRAMEAEIEASWPKKLGFESTTIIRSKKQIDSLLSDGPFEGIPRSEKTNVAVTFVKSRPRTEWKFPFRGEGYTVLGIWGREICSVMQISEGTSDLMRRIEKEFGKQVTTRSLNTVERILRKMNER